MHIFELIVYAFATSTVFLCLFCITIFMFKLNIEISFIAFIIFTIVLIVLSTYFIFKGYIKLHHIYFIEDIDDKYYFFAVRLIMLLLFIVMLFGFEIEVLNIGQEDAVTLLPSLRILNLDTIYYNQMLFKSGDVSIYIIPVYSFVISLISYLSGLEVIQVYIRIRFFLSLIVLLNVFVLCKTLFPQQKYLHWYVLLVSISCIINGWGYRFSSAAWAQFFPYTQYQDLALCVIVPIALMLFYKGLRQEVYFLILAFLLTFSLFFIHIREVLILLLIFSSITLSLFISTKERHVFIKGGIVVLSIVVIGFVLKYFQSMLISPYILKWNFDFKLAVNEIISELVSNYSLINYFFPPLENLPQFFSSFDLFYQNPYYIIVFLFLPFIFCFYRNQGLLIIGAINLSIAIVSIIPIFALYTVKITYSQFLFGGPAYFGMFPLNYIFFSFILITIIKYSYTVFKESPIALFFIIAIVLFILLLMPQWLYYINPGIFYLWVFVGSVIFILLDKLRFNIIRIFDKENEIQMDSKKFMIACLITLFLLSSDSYNKIIINLKPTFQAKSSSSSVVVKTFEENYYLQRKNVSVVNWSEWLKNNFKGVSEDSINYTRKKIPIDSIFAVPINTIYEFLITTGRYVYSSGHYISMVESVFFEELYNIKYNQSLHNLIKDDNFRINYLKHKEPRLLKENKNIQYYGALVNFCDDLMREEQPIFNKKDSPDMTLFLIKKFNIQFIYTPPEWYDHLEELSVKLKGKILKIYDKDNYAIYKVNLL